MYTVILASGIYNPLIAGIHGVVIWMPGLRELHEHSPKVAEKLHEPLGALGPLGHGHRQRGDQNCQMEIMDLQNASCFVIFDNHPILGYLWGHRSWAIILPIKQGKHGFSIMHSNECKKHGTWGCGFFEWKDSVPAPSNCIHSMRCPHTRHIPCVSHAEAQSKGVSKSDNQSVLSQERTDSLNARKKEKQWIPLRFCDDMEFCGQTSE